MFDVINVRNRNDLKGKGKKKRKKNWSYKKQTVAENQSVEEDNHVQRRKTTSLNKKRKGLSGSNVRKSDEDDHKMMILWTMKKFCVPNVLSIAVESGLVATVAVVGIM